MRSCPRVHSTTQAYTYMMNLELANVKPLKLQSKHSTNLLMSSKMPTFHTPVSIIITTHPFSHQGGHLQSLAMTLPKLEEPSCDFCCNSTLAIPPTQLLSLLCPTPTARLHFINHIHPHLRPSSPLYAIVNWSFYTTRYIPSTIMETNQQEPSNAKFATLTTKIKALGL